MNISILDFEVLMKCILTTENCQNTTSEDIQLLKTKLLSAYKVNPQELAPDVVTMNSFVKLNQVNTGIIYTVKLVYPEFEDMKEWKVSIFSALGRAIFLRKIGDQVIYKSRKREMRVKIMDVIFQPEANGNYYMKI